MARITRKDLKTDKFALEVEHTVDFFEEHRREVLRYGAIALAVVLAILALWSWRRHQQAARGEALAQAIQVQEAPISGAAPPPGSGMITFPTQQAKDQAAQKEFGAVASKYSGSGEGLIAEYYLASIAADQGKIQDAEKRFKQVADSGEDRYASLAKLALARIYFATGRAAEGEKLLRGLIEKPTIFVSKEEAAIALARQLALTKPAEARKLLDPLRTSRPAVSQVAIQLYSELAQQ
ncbi:MAG: tetratricopeptide repeat protein [Bryobacteraceae bacterium]